MKLAPCTKTAMREAVLEKGKIHFVLVEHCGFWFPASHLVGEDWTSKDPSFVQAVASRLCEDGYKAEAVA